MKKQYLICNHCEAPVTRETSEVHRVNKSSNLIQRFCFPCLDKYIFKTKNWKFPYSEDINGSYIRLKDGD